MYYFLHRTIINSGLLFALLLAMAMPAPALSAQKPASIDSSETLSIDLPAEQVQRLAMVMALLHKYYVAPVDDKKLLDSTIASMVANLDPHSDFLDKDALKDMETTTSGQFEGIGIEVVPTSDGFIKVISPIDGTPAFNAGIKSGDLIIRVNHKLIRDLTLRDAINQIRGQRGTIVKLTVLRQYSKKPLEFSITRKSIKLHPVSAELLEEGYGYMRLSSFQENTRDEVVKQISKLQRSSPAPLRGIIIDLRDNPGGLLDVAVNVTNLFLDSAKLKQYKGVIVYTKGRIPSSNLQAFASGKDILKGLPLVVLINEGSASASEIMAGALKDYKRATIVGNRSFGKGSVQTILPVDEQSALKLTTALYYTPSGISIQARGIEPDIEIPNVTIEKPTDDEDQSNFSITEADLSKHLASSEDPHSADLATQREKIIAQKLTKLLYSDFQLLQALNILKGLQSGINQ